eukprot:CAMPEP_0175073080 /NCGR_PEP_ID=MMETSP0052_2-20121109/20324_1 /TAXON_ID=51329 ORGANISM="Polytomella parva, Strain SAG 63-3" /NCGR_SAMPLE_ID=MMETSP0052_2 /ASSEMBLY_ACC=CAM_ASM_000194 /LENGTH=870 /DNA_ID=CAMNT_0016340771 /DNA_START=18 /DNA_END=2627 /DNA_ORIENTATION=-
MIPIGALWDQLVDCICRPPRDSYDIDALLGGTNGVFRIINTIGYREDFEIYNKKGLKLVCSLFRPGTRSFDEPVPCVIYCHCNSGSRRDAEEAVWTLIPLGVAVVAFDFSGSGLSEGQWVTLGANEIDDLECVVNHLRRYDTPPPAFLPEAPISILPRVRVQSIGLWGRSMGAVTALNYGSKDPSIAGLVLDSAFSRLTDLMSEIVSEQKIPVPRALMRVALAAMRRSVQRRAGFDLSRVAPIESAAGSFTPALFGHALGDKFVKMSHSEALLKAYAGDKNLVKFEGDHNSLRPDFFYHSVSIFFYNTMRLEQLSKPPASAPSESIYDFLLAEGYEEELESEKSEAGNVDEGTNLFAPHINSDSTKNNGNAPAVTTNTPARELDESSYYDGIFEGSLDNREPVDVQFAHEDAVHKVVGKEERHSLNDSDYVRGENVGGKTDENSSAKSNIVNNSGGVTNNNSPLGRNHSFDRSAMHWEEYNSKKPTKGGVADSGSSGQHSDQSVSGPAFLPSASLLSLALPSNSNNDVGDSKSNNISMNSNMYASYNIANENSQGASPFIHITPNKSEKSHDANNVTEDQWRTSDDGFHRLRGLSSGLCYDENDVPYVKSASMISSSSLAALATVTMAATASAEGSALDGRPITATPANTAVQDAGKRIEALELDEANRRSLSDPRSHGHSWEGGGGTGARGLQENGDDFGGGGYGGHRRGGEGERGERIKDESPVSSHAHPYFYLSTSTSTPTSTPTSTSASAALAKAMRSPSSPPYVLSSPVSSTSPSTRFSTSPTKKSTAGSVSFSSGTPFLASPSANKMLMFSDAGVRESRSRMNPIIRSSMSSLAEAGSLLGSLSSFGANTAEAAAAVASLAVPD